MVLLGELEHNRGVTKPDSIRECTGSLMISMSVTGEPSSVKRSVSSLDGCLLLHIRSKYHVMS